MGNGSAQPVSWSPWGVRVRRPNLPSGVLRIPLFADGLFRCDPPSTFTASKAVALDPNTDPSPSPSDPNTVAMNLHVFSGPCFGVRIETRSGGWGRRHSGPLISPRTCRKRVPRRRRPSTKNFKWVRSSWAIRLPFARWKHTPSSASWYLRGSTGILLWLAGCSFRWPQDYPDGCRG